MVSVSGTGNSGTSTIHTGLVAGNYDVTVTQAVLPSCSKTVNVDINQPTAVGIVVDANINANCLDQAQVTVHGTGGTPWLHICNCAIG